MIVMKLHMNAPHFVSLEQVKYFLKTNEQVAFEVGDSRGDQSYRWISRTLLTFNYGRLKKKDKIIVVKFIRKITGYSKAHTKRLIKKFYKGELRYIGRGHHREKFPRIYGPEDIALLIHTDRVHGKLSSQATARILRREYETFGKEEYEKISQISSSHIYNLRGRRQYLWGAAFFHTTQSVAIPIGERRKPEPNGKPGYLRVDSVHQGDFDGEKGIYYINIVDEVTQYEFVGCLPYISRDHLVPMLHELLDLFPFKIIEFHADNGSEYINHEVARMLNEMVVDLTKSRPRHSGDNALVECKNGAIIRKHFGYMHIPKGNAGIINEFLQKYFNAYINYHRPCGFATIKIDGRRKEKKVYNIYQTPYEALKSRLNAKEFLKDGVSFEKLDIVAYAKSDNEAAEEMTKAKEIMLRRIKYHSTIVNKFTI